MSAGPPARKRQRRSAGKRGLHKGRQAVWAVRASARHPAQECSILPQLNKLFGFAPMLVAASGCSSLGGLWFGGGCNTTLKRGSRMIKFCRRLPAWLAILPFAMPMNMPVMAESMKGNGIPHCPPAPTQKVATLTYNIHVTGEHKTQMKVGSANMARERDFNGVVRMVYQGDVDIDGLDPRSPQGSVTKTAGTPDSWGPGTKGPIVNPVRSDASSGGALGNFLERLQECESLVGDAVLACQMPIIKAVDKAKKECKLKGGKLREDGFCGGGSSGDQARIPELPGAPGQCIPGKKGVKTGPFELWTSTACTVDVSVYDRGQLMLVKDNTANVLIPVNQVEAGHGGTKRPGVGCSAIVIISKMTNTASVMLEHAPTTIMVTDVTGGHAGRITDYADGDKMKQTFAALKSTGAQISTGARSPINWSAAEWNKGGNKRGIIIPNSPRNGSTTKFNGSWTHQGSNPPGIYDYVYGEGRNSRSGTKTVLATSTTKVSWKFDADPNLHVVK